MVFSIVDKLNVKKIITTSMHSSRMRTAACCPYLPVYIARGCFLQGVSTPAGVCVWSLGNGGVCLWSLGNGGVCLWSRGCLPLVPGVYPNMH